MSTWYYGVIRETDKEIVVMYVGKSLSYPEEIVVRHIEYTKVILRALDEAEKGFTRDLLEFIDDAVQHLKKVYTPELLLYIMLCLKLGIEPRIISEYELFDEIEEKQGKKVIILGEKG